MDLEELNAVDLLLAHFNLANYSFPGDILKKLVNNFVIIRVLISYSKYSKKEISITVFP